MIFSAYSHIQTNILPTVLSHEKKRITYEGEIKNEWEDGFGKHKFPNGVIYEGNFTKGEQHGDGTLIYPNGVSILDQLNYFRAVTLLSGTEAS